MHRCRAVPIPYAHTVLMHGVSDCIRHVHFAVGVIPVFGGHLVSGCVCNVRICGCRKRGCGCEGWGRRTFLQVCMLGIFVLLWVAGGHGECALVDV